MPVEMLFVILGGLTCITVVVHSVVNAVVKVQSLRRGTPVPGERSDVSARLEQIEVALEALAVEAERNGESQRYLVRLLSEQAKPLASARERGQITPH